MDIGSDGSLCRITNSAKNYSNNVMILKKPDDEKQSSNLTYKFVSIFPDKNRESSSDKSDEEDVYNMFEVKLGEMSNNNDSKVLDEKKKSTSKANNFEKVEYHKEQEFRTNTDWRKYRWISHDRANRGIKKYRSSNVNNSFIQKSTPAPSGDISPWLPHVYHPQYGYNSFTGQNYSENFQPFSNVDTVLSTSSNCDPSSMPIGLLGDSPYSLNLHQFHHNLNNFPNQNYREDYNSNGYSRPRPDMQTPPIEHGYRKRYQQNQRNKTWPRKRGKNSRGWKRSKVKPSRGRTESNDYYSYRR